MVDCCKKVPCDTHDEPTYTWYSVLIFSHGDKDFT
jgi:hypothetical protein